MTQLNRIGAALPLLLLIVACGKKDESPPPQAAPQPGAYGQQQPTYGQQQPAYGQQQPTYGQQQPAYGQQQPAQQQAAQQQPPGQMTPLGAVLADPSAMQNILAGALSGGAAALGAMTGGEQGPIEQGIKMQAQTQAKGMVPEGQLMTARLQQDGHAEGAFTLQPGACYTVIGFGGMGAFDYQINIVTAPPMPPQILAQSPAGGVAPIVGANQQCVRSPYPLPLVVNIDMHLLRGQALVGAQVYKK